MFKATLFCAGAVVLVLSGALLLSCGGGSSNSMTSKAAMINLTVSDPATCSAPQGPFSHIYVTITDVQINASSSAGDNDPGWIDLTPGLSQNPQQVDLLGLAGNQCFLAMLGSSCTKSSVWDGTAKRGAILGRRCPNVAAMSG